MGDAARSGGDFPAGTRSAPCQQPHADGESSGRGKAASGPDCSGCPLEGPSPPASKAARRRDPKSAGSGPEGAREVLQELHSRPLAQETVESGGSSMGGAATRVKEEDQLESQLQVLRNCSHPLALDVIQALGELARVATQLLTEAQQPDSSPASPECRPPDKEKQQLQQRMASHEELISQLLAQNEQLEQEVQELKRHQQASRAQATAYQRPTALSPWYFPVQVRTTGKTGGCEKQFLEDVSNSLAGDRVFLCVEDYQKNSDRFLLVFCPVTSRMGTDIENALEGLGGVQKTVLVVLHLKPKDSTRLYVNTKRQVQHQTVVVTVHAFYTMQDGFYPCNENREAVASVVAAIRNYPRGS